MTLDLAISGMTCLDCSRHVTTALERVDGVSAAHVDYRAGAAHVELRPGVSTSAELERALSDAVERAGYHAEPVASDPSGTAAATNQPVSVPGAGRSV